MKLFIQCNLRYSCQEVSSKGYPNSRELPDVFPNELPRLPQILRWNSKLNCCQEPPRCPLFPTKWHLKSFRN
ncbi:hypothetical protein EPI10_027674 [Gossypium australe]|uniref:Uncharacterized protein n=1 Tax=Gossypium australe TaxID=47621 RepID=A0A5B6USK7_9ROSI|nr:hypothetical protein EPI10_027674 [Gossypium australe]